MTSIIDTPEVDSRPEGTDPATWWVHYARATAWHCRGDHDRARAAYERSVALQPNPMALRGLAILSDDPAKRRDLYAQAMRIAFGQDVGRIYLWHRKNIMAHQARLVGYRPISDGMIRLQGMRFQ